jgi:hypothetical protein
MLDKEHIIRLFEKTAREKSLSLTNQQRDIYSIIAGVVSNTDNLNENDLTILRRMALKGYDDSST